MIYGGGIGARRHTLAARCVRAALAGALALALGAIAASGAHASTVWLCRPGLSNDPCKALRKATVITYESGARKQKPQPQVGAGPRAIDCFYVYPTVSEQKTPNANLEIEPQETQIAIDQASRFSEDCRVFAPVYPQLTLAAINSPGSLTEEDVVKAYLGGSTPGTNTSRSTTTDAASS